MEKEWDGYIGTNYTEEIRRLTARVNDLELILYGCKEKGIPGIAEEVSRFRRYFYYISGGWAVLGFIWAVIQLALNK